MKYCSLSFIASALLLIILTLPSPHNTAEACPFLIKQMMLMDQMDNQENTDLKEQKEREGEKRDEER